MKESFLIIVNFNEIIFIRKRIKDNYNINENKI